MSNLTICAVTFALVLGALGGPSAAAADAQYKVGDKLAPAKDAARSGDFRLTKWEDLVPKDWNPMKDLQDLNLGMLSDGDPRAIEALNRLRRAWDTAPPERSMDNQRIRIAGFVVPLEFNNDRLREFLRRLHPRSTAARQPDHPRHHGQAAPGRTRDGNALGERSIARFEQQHVDGNLGLPDGGGSHRAVQGEASAVSGPIGVDCDLRWRPACGAAATRAYVSCTGARSRGTSKPAAICQAPAPSRASSMVDCPARSASNSTASAASRIGREDGLDMKSSLVAAISKRRSAA
jgi:hypothetical protein